MNEYVTYMEYKDIKKWEEKHGSKIYSDEILKQFHKCTMLRSGDKNVRTPSNQMRELRAMERAAKKRQQTNKRINL